MGALDDAADLLMRTSGILHNGHIYAQKQDLGAVYDALILLGQPAVDAFNEDLQQIVALTDQMLPLIYNLNDQLRTASHRVRAGMSISGE
jgi:hypothetical protein